MKLLPITAALALTYLPAYSFTVASFEFTGNSLASNDAGTSWTTTSLASGGGVPETFDGAEGQPAPSLGLSMGDINDGTLLDDDYYTFTITPGASLQFESFSIDINKISGGADVFARLYSDIDGFGSEIGNAQVSPTDEWNTYSIDLSGLAAQTTPTEFRVYLETGGTFGPNPIKLDNITVTAVPEPSLAALCSLGLFGFLRRRR
jgi:hypothetical protein